MTSMNNQVISFFQPPVTNTTVVAGISVIGVVKAVKSGVLNEYEYKTAIDQIRNINTVGKVGKKQRDELKKTRLPGLTFSGVFNKRSEQGLEQYSGLICLDFDNVEGLNEVKSQLNKDSFTHVCFVSPSGTGIKLVVKVPKEVSLHSSSFAALQEYYKEHYSLIVDKSGKDVSRLCFASYDPNVFYNESSEIFDYQTQSNKVTSPAVKPNLTIPAEQTVYDRVEHCVLQIEQRQIDITEDYQQWLNIGFALANEFGEQGRGFFHRISMYYPNYDTVEAESKYNNLLKTTTGSITISTFFEACKQSGITIFLPKNSSEKTEKKLGNKSEKTQKKQTKNTKNSLGKGFDEKIGGDKLKHDNADNTLEIADIFHIRKRNDEGVAIDITIIQSKFLDLLLSMGFRRYDIDENSSAC